ncbi:MAG: choice-of-anchor D domain-containing protein [Sumerlaeia bacterium]
MAPLNTWASPVIEASINTLTFPTTCITLPNQLNLIIENTGVDPLVYTSINVIDPSGDFRLLEAPNLTNQPAGEVRTLTIEFSPTSSGNHNGTLEIVTNDPLYPILTIPLNGTGTGSRLSLSALAVDFGNFLVNSGATPNQPITISNTGSSVLTFAGAPATGVQLVGDNADQFMIVSDTGETTLNPGESRLIILSFVPTFRQGNEAALEIFTDPTADCDRFATIALTGAGISGPFVEEIITATNSPSSAQDLEWYVRFNRKVVGVDASDFSLFGAGTTGAAVESVTRLTFDDNDEPEWYLVRASTGSLSTDPATLGLTLNDDNSIRDVLFSLQLEAEDGTPDGTFIGEDFVIDRTAPDFVLSKLDPDPTDLDSVRFLVDVSEPLGLLALEETISKIGFLAGDSSIEVSVPNITAVPRYEYTVTATPNDPNTDGTLGISVGAQSRVNRGLLVRYDLAERAGLLISDSSGFGAPANIPIPADERFKMQWLNENGIEVIDVLLATNIVPSKIYSEISDPITGSNEFSIEVLFEIDNLNQTGPVRLISLSNGTAQRNVFIGLQNNDLILRTRTVGNVSGDEPAVVADDILTAGLHHIIATRSADGNIRIFHNGRLAVETNLNLGDLSNWDENFQLVLCNETTGNRAFDGSLRYAAIHHVALTAEEVAQNAAVLPLTDLAGNALTTSDSVLYVIDQNPPVIDSIEREFEELTNRTILNWIVTFNEPVTGLDVTGPTFDNFSLTANGVAGAEILSVVPVPDEPTQFRVSVDRGNGDGTLSLNLSQAASIVDQANRALVATLNGPAYTIDTQAPTLISITRVESSPTRNLDVHFRVEFSEPVSGLDESDFQIFETNFLTGAEITSINEYPSEPNAYEIHVNTGTGDGELTLAMISNPTIGDRTQPTSNLITSIPGNPSDFFIVDKNDEPADILITGTTVTNGDPAGTLVGELSAIDFDLADTHTFTLVAPFFGAAGLFEIVNGNELRTAKTVDLNTITLPVLISVRATDNGPDTIPPTGTANLFLRESMTITIIPANTSIPYWENIQY